MQQAVVHSHVRALPPPLPLDAVTPNRRSWRRRPIQLRVDLVPVLDQVGAPSDGRARRGVTTDLSPDGMLCSRVGYLPLGSLVRLFVGLPDRQGGPVACYARVMRCSEGPGRRPPGYGLKLVGIGPSEVERIRRLTQSGTMKAG